MRTSPQLPSAHLSPWYVTGFVNGVGSFTYNRNGSQLLLVFAVRLAAKDRAVLETIQRFFGGIGKIYTAAAGCYYRVNRTAELLTVVDHFDRHPLHGEKQKVYEIWREMVFIKTAHFGSPHPDELDRLAEKLSRAVPRNRPSG